MCLILGNDNGVQVHGNIQNDFTGFTLNDFLFVQSTDFKGNHAISALDVPNGTFRKIHMDQEFLSILGACHITFEDDNLVLKIGGYRGYFGHENLALKTTKILQFSKPLLGFSAIADFEVSKGLKIIRLLKQL